MRFVYYLDTNSYSDEQFLMQHWMHCVMDTSEETPRVVARCTVELEARLLATLLNLHYTTYKGDTPSCE